MDWTVINRWRHWVCTLLRKSIHIESIAILRFFLYSFDWKYLFWTFLHPIYPMDISSSISSSNGDFSIKFQSVKNSKMRIFKDLLFSSKILIKLKKKLVKIANSSFKVFSKQIHRHLHCALGWTSSFPTQSLAKGLFNSDSLLWICHNASLFASCTHRILGNLRPLFISLAHTTIYSFYLWDKLLLSVAWNIKRIHTTRPNCHEP